MPHNFETVMKELLRQRIELERREFNNRLVRDARGLPTVEQEMGWRMYFRGGEGGRD